MERWADDPIEGWKGRRWNVGRGLKTHTWTNTAGRGGAAGQKRGCPPGAWGHGGDEDTAYLGTLVYPPSQC